MRKKFKKKMAALDEIFEFVGAFIEAEGIDETTAFAVNFAIEEIFTNMVKYSQHNNQDVLLDLSRDDKRIVISATEYDVDEFDITKVAEVDTNLETPERKIGGLGLHLTRQVMDEVSYRYQNRNSTVTLIKYLEN